MVCHLDKKKTPTHLQILSWCSTEYQNCCKNGLARLRAATKTGCTPCSPTSASTNSLQDHSKKKMHGKLTHSYIVSFFFFFRVSLWFVFALTKQKEHNRIKKDTFR